MEQNQEQVQIYPKSHAYQNRNTLYCSIQNLVGKHKWLQSYSSKRHSDYYVHQGGWIKNGFLVYAIFQVHLEGRKVSFSEFEMK